MTELQAFIDGWQDESGCKALLLAIQNLAAELGLKTEYVGRPGVSHSLRLGKAGSKRPFFALADVIDDDPSARWLSLCMYADVAADPDGRGDLVPGGLNGRDAVCFDLDAPGADDEEYILEVIRQAAQKA